MDIFHKKLCKGLLIFQITKNVIYIILIIFGASFYLPDITNVPLAIVTLLGLIIYALHLITWMSVKFGSILKTEPNLAAVRTKVIHLLHLNKPIVLGYDYICNRYHFRYHIGISFGLRCNHLIIGKS